MPSAIASPSVAQLISPKPISPAFVRLLRRPISIAIDGSSVASSRLNTIAACCSGVMRTSGCASRSRSTPEPARMRPPSMPRSSASISMNSAYADDTVALFNWRAASGTDRAMRGTPERFRRIVASLARNDTAAAL